MGNLNTWGIAIISVFCALCSAAEIHTIGDVESLASMDILLHERPVQNYSAGSLEIVLGNSCGSSGGREVIIKSNYDQPTAASVCRSSVQLWNGVTQRVRDFISLPDIAPRSTRVLGCSITNGGSASHQVDWTDEVPGYAPDRLDSDPARALMVLVDRSVVWLLNAHRKQRVTATYVVSGTQMMADMAPGEKILFGTPTNRGYLVSARYFPSYPNEQVCTN